MSQYLFLFSVTPVQSFIVQARKTHDLYSGSSFLSSLCRAAIEEASRAGADIVFPYWNKSGKDDSIPNRFIAKIEKEENELKDFAQKVEQAAKAKFNDTAKKILAKLKLNETEAFKQQLSDYFKFYWVFHPIGSDDYQKAYNEIEAQNGAVKNIRSFKQTNETGRKCSICGERNVLFVLSGEKQKFQLKPNWNLMSDAEKQAIKAYNDSLVDVSIIPIFLQKNEGLCALCFCKRFYRHEESFPSTAKIALFEVISKLHKENPILIKSYKNLFSHGDLFNEQLFNEENLTEDYFQENGLERLIDSLPVIQEKQKELKRYVRENLNFDLTKYYAVLVFDGDSMGEWLSGIRIKESVPLENFHQELSEKLSEFSKFAKEYLDEEPRGKTVYTGGDDFLGFVNLRYLFTVLAELRLQFKKIVSDPLNNYFGDPNDELSFSAGITIAHYKSPLSTALQWARKAEKDAKNFRSEKNAFAISVLKRSGEITQVICQWNSDTFNSIQLMEELAGKIAVGELSNTFIKYINMELKPLSLPSKIAEIEIKRLLLRSFIKKSQETEAEFKERKINEGEKLVEQLANLYVDNKKQFFSFLNVIDFCARNVMGYYADEN